MHAGWTCETTVEMNYYKSKSDMICSVCVAALLTLNENMTAKYNISMSVSRLVKGTIAVSHPHPKPRQKVPQQTRKHPKQNEKR